MEQLPTPLFCLTLAHSIDDFPQNGGRYLPLGGRNIVERFLEEYPNETQQCIPIALRIILETPELPTVPFFTSRELIDHLNVL